MVSKDLQVDSADYTMHVTPHTSECFGELNLENLPKIAIEFCWNVENQVLISESAETSVWEDAG